jgi:Outer membrane protein beta-barrel domain
MKNLKMILLPAGICFLFLTTAAQPRSGIKAGLNYAGLSGYNGNSRLSFHAGIFVQANLNKNKNWRIQPELLYSGEGQHYTVNVNEDIIKNTIALNYVALPVVVQYFPTPSLYFETGPQLAVLVAAYSNGSGADHMNLKRSFGNTQFGLNLGAGVFLNQRISFYGRYYFGLTDITPYSSDMNRSSAGQFGIAFQFKKKNKAVQ